MWPTLALKHQNMYNKNMLILEIDSFGCSSMHPYHDASVQPLTWEEDGVKSSTADANPNLVLASVAPTSSIPFSFPPPSPSYTPYFTRVAQ